MINKSLDEIKINKRSNSEYEIMKEPSVGLFGYKESPIDIFQLQPKIELKKEFSIEQKL